MWKDKVLPLLAQHMAEAVDAVLAYMLLYHEASLANLLEACSPKPTGVVMCRGYGVLCLTLLFMLACCPARQTVLRAGGARLCSFLEAGMMMAACKIEAQCSRNS